jgi:CheY-like chemotaxis protein
VSGGPKIVLLVDDHPLNLKLRVTHLERFPWIMPLTANSVTEALQTARNIKPDVIVSDIRMERVDAGYALCRELRKDPDLAQIPVILYTAGDLTPEQVVMAKDLGVVAVFERSSVDIEPLVAKIREILG